MDAFRGQLPFKDSLEFFEKSLNLKKTGEPISVYLIDDGSYSGSQAANVIENLGEYAQANRDKKVSLHIGIPYFTEKALAKIKQTASKFSKNKAFSVVVYENTKEIPHIDVEKADDKFYAGSMIMEFKVPDKWSFVGPDSYESRLEDALVSPFPPYKKFDPVLS